MAHLRAEKLRRSGHDRGRRCGGDLWRHPRSTTQNASHDGQTQAGDGTRTRDIQLGKLTLYQLSYTRDGLTVYRSRRRRAAHCTRRSMSEESKSATTCARRSSEIESRASVDTNGGAPKTNAVSATAFAPSAAQSAPNPRSAIVPGRRSAACVRGSLARSSFTRSRIRSVFGERARSSSSSRGVKSSRTPLEVRCGVSTIKTSTSRAQEMSVGSNPPRVVHAVRSTSQLAPAVPHVDKPNGDAWVIARPIRRPRRNRLEIARTAASGVVNGTTSSRPLEIRAASRSIHGRMRLLSPTHGVGRSLTCEVR